MGQRMGDILAIALMGLMLYLLGRSFVDSARDRKRLVARVHEAATVWCCASCGSPYRPWDGRLDPITFLRHINAECGPRLVHQIRLECGRCDCGHEFLVNSDGELVDTDLFR
jgi:hypothetical protein